ncbi:MAG: DUF47 family protein [Bacteroidales bacterium]|nr:DUF47 family protein [Bacteroidales bacterium]
MNDPVKRIRHFFAPKKSFLPLYTKQAQYLKGAAEALVEMMETTDVVTWRRLEKEVKMCEVQGDAIVAELYNELSEGLFVLRKSDLQTIAMQIDEFLDDINGAAKSILLYLPSKVDSQLVDMAQYIMASADALAEVLPKLGEIKRYSKDISRLCARVTELEHAADEAYEEYIAHIFLHEKDAKELMKYKNIAEVFENATDGAKSVSDFIANLLLSRSER